MVCFSLSWVVKLDPESVENLLIAFLFSCGQKPASAVYIFALCHSFLIITAIIALLHDDACNHKVIRIFVVVLLLLIDRINLGLSYSLICRRNLSLGFGELFLGTSLLSLLLFLGLSILAFTLFFLLGQVVLHLLIATPETFLHFSRICRKI